MNNKVCIMTSAHTPFDTRIFHKEAKSLARAGYEVTLVAPHTADETVDGVRIKAVPKAGNRLERMSLTALRVFIAARGEKADIYHFHDPELVPLCMALKALGNKVVFDVHEYYRLKILTKHWISKPLRRAAACLYDRLENLAGRMFDGVVVVDPVIEEKFNGRAVRISNFPYPPEAAPPAVSRAKERVFTCVYAGGLEEDRGLFMLIKSMEHVEGRIRLVLAGNYVREKDRLKAEAMKGYEKVEWLGFRPWREVMALLACSDLGMLLLQPTPSYRAAGGGINKLFEYMSAGLPVLGSNFPNIESIIAEAGCGATVDPTDPAAIAREIMSLAEDPAARGRMGENGRKAVREKYNWEEESRKLIELYEKCCPPNASRL